MVDDFIFWLKGIEEDDYLPLEIKHIYFYISGSDIGMGGRETFSERIGDFEFYPLEAQFFNKSYNITKFDSKLLKLKLLVEDSFEDKELKEIYKDRHIHIGYLLDKVAYSFVNVE